MANEYCERKVGGVRRLSGTTIGVDHVGIGIGAVGAHPEQRLGRHTA